MKLISTFLAVMMFFTTASQAQVAQNLTFEQKKEMIQTLRSSLVDLERELATAERDETTGDTLVSAGMIVAALSGFSAAMNAAFIGVNMLIDGTTTVRGGRVLLISALVMALGFTIGMGGKSFVRLSQPHKERLMKEIEIVKNRLDVLENSLVSIKRWSQQDAQ